MNKKVQKPKIVANFSVPRNAIFGGSQDSQFGHRPHIKTAWIHFPQKTELGNLMEDFESDGSFELIENDGRIVHECIITAYLLVFNKNKSN